MLENENRKRMLLAETAQITKTLRRQTRAAHVRLSQIIDELAQIARAETPAQPSEAQHEHHRSNVA